MSLDGTYDANNIFAKILRGEMPAARVFEEFEQADGSVTRRFGGTGLGMSIVRRLTEMMGGSVALDTRVGRGTTVRVSLPLPEAP